MTASSKPLLLGEVATSSGPRKRQGDARHDPELGEDSGGILFLNGTVWVWIADGTSETSNTGGLSSRLLAQDLGRVFCSHLLEQGATSNPIPLNEWIEETVNQVKAEWSRRIQTGGETHRILHEQLSALSEPQQNPQGGAVFLEFSSTFSAACLNEQGDLQGISVGDSYLVTNAQGATQFFALKKGNITFRISLKNSDLLLESFFPEPERFENRSVDLVLLSSDGAKDTIRTLHESLGTEFRLTRARYRLFKNHLTSVPSKTYDDKTLAFAARLYED